MATTAAWVLNLDAEYELDNPAGYNPSAAARRRIESYLERARGLLRPGDLLIDCTQTTPDGQAQGRRGAAWCPTPRALACLARAGASPPAAPSLSVLQRVNHRGFSQALQLDDFACQWAPSLECARSLLERPSPSGCWVAKRAFGLSGRDNRRLRAPLSGADGDWLRASFRHGHGLVIEPWVERLADFAIHGWLDTAGRLELGRGLRQECDVKGVWQRTVRDDAALSGAELQALTRSAQAVAQALHAAGYFGPFGVDAFRYAAADGRPAFRSCVEINARFTMGYALSGLPTA